MHLCFWFFCRFEEVYSAAAVTRDCFLVADGLAVVARVRSSPESFCYSGGFASSSQRCMTWTHEGAAMIAFAGVEGCVTVGLLLRRP
ncbi:hypothetical protein DEO72_LG3g1283 [Vigna unguiculata]|uniref:Secreted protein n=1 Tax=Vigna unguiculata TaxID=3917 RepID=A0A4D6LDU9_VIGUN|nr:hypothetical protein DEO72_LG3g1283 [Vigna unguiculata]